MAARTTSTSSSRSTSSSAASTRTGAPSKRSSSRSVYTTTDPGSRLDTAIFEAIRGSRTAVDLETVLERVDFAERMVPTYEQLGGGLQRLGDSGLIRQTQTGTYVDGQRSSLGAGVGDLPRDVYDAAVRRYRDRFAQDVVSLNSSMLSRVPVRLLELAHRATVGRFGLEPGIVDLDGTSLLFLLCAALEPMGWSCQPASGRDDTRRIAVAPIDADLAANQTAVVAEARRTLAGERRLRRLRVRLVLPDSAEIDISP